MSARAKAVVSENWRGRPEFDFAEWRDARPAAERCPTGAISLRDCAGVREVAIARPRVEKRPIPAIAAPRASREPSEAPADVKPAPAAPLPAPAAAQARPNAAYQPLALWPATQSQGAYGRIVRIGAFGTRLQAKLGWRYMVQSFPAVAHLPAAVVESRKDRILKAAVIDNVNERGNTIE